MGKLPQVPYMTGTKRIKHYTRDVLDFRGLNLTPTAQDGELTMTRGITTKKYPYISQVPDITETYTWEEEGAVKTYEDPISLFEWDGYLYVVQSDGKVYRNGGLIGTMDTPASGQHMAVVNTKLCIFPDKYYVDLTDNTLHSLIKNTWTGSLTVTIDTDYATLAGTGIENGFEENDVIDIAQDDLKIKRLTVKTVGTDEIVVSLDDNLAYLDLTSSVKVMTSVPDLTFICLSNNRLWGVDEDNNTIYASALGDPTEWFDYSGDSGSYTVVVGSPGMFTGICEYGGAVCAWKENILHKILGQYPSEYYMITSAIYGVKGGCHRSLIAINGLLYYMSPYGMCVYGGNRPSLISSSLGETSLADVCCGTDGRFLYLACQVPAAGTDEGPTPWPIGSHLFAYDIDRSMWVSEAEDKWYTAIVYLYGTIYFLYWGDAHEEGTNAVLFHAPSVAASHEWVAELAEVTENTFARKGYVKLNVRLDMEPSSSIKIYAKEDRRAYRKIWERANTASNDYNPVTMTVPIRLGRCDRWQMKFEGTGNVTIRGIEREHVLGSEK